MTDVSLFNLTCCPLTIFFFFFLFRRSTSHYLAIKISHTDFQMKMEDMPLSGPDNTKLEVSASPTRQTLCLSAVLFCVFLNYLSRCRLWSMTSTLSWWKTPVWACVLRYIGLWNKAISSWTKRTKRAWRSSVGATNFPLCSVLIFLWCVRSPHLIYYSSRNCGPARSGHIWPSVQSVEKQRVRVSELQKTDSGFSLRPAPGEMPGHGTQQQPHRQPQVGQWRSFRSHCWVWTSDQIV